MVQTDCIANESWCKLLVLLITAGTDC